MRFAYLPLTTFLALLGCGDDVAPPVDAPNFDMQTDQSGDTMDGDEGTPDGDTDDASMDADGGQSGTCAIELLGVVGSDSRALANPIQASAGADGAILTWQERRDGKQDVYLRPIPNSGGVGDEVKATDTFSSSSTPSVLANSRLLSWSDNTTGNFEIYTATLDDLTPQQLSNNTFRDAAPVLVSSDNPLIFWMEADAQLKGGVLSATGALNSACVAVNHPIPDFFSAAKYEDGAIISWVEPATAVVHVQRTDQNGCAVGAETPISDAAVTAGFSEVAHVPERGGVVAYDVDRRVVETQAITLEGAKSGFSIPLTEGSARGYGPSIASYAGGFVVSYWATDRDLEDPEVRVRFLDSNGKPVGEAQTVATGGDSPARTKVVVSNDGTLFVFYSTDQPTLKIEVGRLTCAQ